MIINDHYLFSLFVCDPIAREWYPCDVALSIVYVFVSVYLLLSIEIQTQKVSRPLCTYLKRYGEVMYVPKRSQVITTRDWKGHGAVSAVPIMTIQSIDRTMGSDYLFWNEYTILW